MKGEMSTATCSQFLLPRRPGRAALLAVFLWAATALPGWAATASPESADTLPPKAADTASPEAADTAPADGAAVQDLANLSLEQLMAVEVPTVVGASKYEQKVTEAPASVSIVTASEIRKYGYRTLADALRSVRGIYVTNDRNYNYLGVRGFNRPGDYNSRALLLVDGHRINDNIYDSAPIGSEFPVDIDLVDRIEIIRGPSSSLYGANAFFGVINVITRQAGDLKGARGGEVAAAAGSYETYNGRVSYGREFHNGLGVLLSASTLHSDGPDRLSYPEFAALNNGVAEHADRDRNYQLYSKFTLGDFTLVGAYTSRVKNVPTASFATVFNDARFQTTDNHGFLDLRYLHDFDDHTQLTARAFYDRYYYRGDYPSDLANDDNTVPAANPPQVVLNRDLAWGNWWGGELQLTRVLPGRNKVSLGTEYRDNLQQHQQNYDVAPYQQHLDDRRSSSIWALYLQDELQLLDSLILSAGVRYDHYHSFGGTTNPRLALIYKPLEGSVFKLLYGNAFRAPNAYELYYDDRVNNVANPGLRPEKIDTYEAIYEQYFREHYRTSLSGFYYRVHDLITSQPVDPNDPLSPTHYVNVDSVVARGVELELEGKWKGGYEGRVSYTYQKAENGDTRAALTNSPDHLAKLNVIVPLYRSALFAGFEEQFQSPRLTLAGNRTSAAYLSNLTIFSRGLLPGLELSASLYNLLDAHYSDPGSPNHVQDSIAQDGRTFRLKASYAF